MADGGAAVVVAPPAVVVVVVAVLQARPTPAARAPGTAAGLGTVLHGPVVVEVAEMAAASVKARVLVHPACLPLRGLSPLHPAAAIDAIAAAAAGVAAVAAVALLVLSTTLNC